ncbi:MAG TPA: CoB--CoM heterodisulfide reductase iron-sulfur subunit A family protein [Geobacteraceae bacterium]|nr:CoB--CoM heterodisulfide reductase iron-sulfur subunit A family protein [Geobacteraceae bacterium]
MDKIRERYDALVIGGGIAGMQTALDLGEQGFDVLLVEKEPSVGGIMVGLNKVFPTLDCSSCICTPRMAEASHHERIRLQTYTEVREVVKSGPGFAVRLLRKPRYIVEDECVGCGQCELACSVDVPHEFDFGLGARRAIYIPHGNAIPQKAVLDVEHCIFCGKCEKACPTHCINYAQEPEEVTVSVGAVIVATGLNITPMNAKKEYGGGRFPNVMDPLGMERVQSSNGPYGRVLRPSDGKVPQSIAYVQCAGSRDRSIGIPYCSRVCCMYALKQALLLTHYIHGVEVTLYYMDIRAFGKGFEQFYRRAVREGVKTVRGKVARITETDNQDLILRVEITESGRVEERRHDLVVLSQGLIPGWHVKGVIPLEEAEDGFLKTPLAKVSPSHTTLDGVFVAGVAAGPKDIPDAIVEAGEAAMAAANHILRTGWRPAGRAQLKAVKK